MTSSIERALFVVMERWLQLPCAARGGVLCVALKHKNPAGQACGILESRKPWAAEGSGLLATSHALTDEMPSIVLHRDIWIRTMTSSVIVLLTAETAIRRLAILDGIPVLPANPDADSVADAIVSRHMMPPNARLDALHVAPNHYSLSPNNSPPLFNPVPPFSVP